MKLLYLPILLTVLALSGCDGGRTNRVRVAITKGEMAAFSTALKMFHDDCGRYPTTDEGLAALIKWPPNVPPEKWRQNYLHAERIPQDPWGHAFVYRCPGVHNANSFDLYSCGEDGESKSGGEDADDINSWNRNSPLVGSDDTGLLQTAGVGAGVFLVVVALAWAERRFRKPQGNLHGVYALLWVSATPTLFMILAGTRDSRNMEDFVLAAFFVWLTLWLLWMISGIRRGSPFSKGCAFMAIIMAIIVALWLGYMTRAVVTGGPLDAEVNASAIGGRAQTLVRAAAGRGLPALPGRHDQG